MHLRNRPQQASSPRQCLLLQYCIAESVEWVLCLLSVQAPPPRPLDLAANTLLQLTAV